MAEAMVSYTSADTTTGPSCRSHRSRAVGRPGKEWFLGHRRLPQQQETDNCFRDAGSRFLHCFLSILELPTGSAVFPAGVVSVHNLLKSRHGWRRSLKLFFYRCVFREDGWCCSIIF